MNDTDRIIDTETRIQPNTEMVAGRFRAVLTLLQTANKKILLNKDFLVSMVRAAGVHNFGPYDPYAEEGGTLLQDPQQLADALLFLSQYKFETYVEIGNWTGHTACFMTAFLLRFNENLRTTCVDPRDIPRESHGLPVQFVVGTSNDLRGQHFDLTHIDGDHSVAWVERDYENVGSHSPVCMFHDIDNADFGILGPGEFWQRVKQAESGSAFFEFKHPAKHFMGIGIRVRRP